MESVPSISGNAFLLEIEQRVIIIGGGLSGLTLAHLLRQRNVTPTILEASGRLGGRIQTVKGKRETPLELGATWFSEMHPNLLSLINELGLKKFPQFSKGITLFQTKSFEPPQQFFIPETEQPSFRLAGGTQKLIDSLAQEIPEKAIHLNSAVTAISEAGEELIVKTVGGIEHRAQKVVLCLPPHLASRIKITPDLPEIVKPMLPTVQTWMLGAVKFVLEYEEPFWRNNGYSGMLYSHSGIVSEMYDHTNFEESRFGFTGFFISGAANYPHEERKEAVLRQLKELLGVEATNPLSYFDKVWTDKFISAGVQDIQKPHQNNGHPLLQKSYMGGKLFFSGTETATEYGGYMEGAIISAQQVLTRILS